MLILLFVFLVTIKAQTSDVCLSSTLEGNCFFCSKDYHTEDAHLLVSFPPASCVPKLQLSTYEEKTVFIIPRPSPFLEAQIIALRQKFHIYDNLVDALAAEDNWSSSILSERILISLIITYSQRTTAILG